MKVNTGQRKYRMKFTINKKVLRLTQTTNKMGIQLKAFTKTFEPDNTLPNYKLRTIILIENYIRIL